MKDTDTRKYNHYLYDLISYLNLNPKSFSENIGLDRADRIYNVLNGKNGISSSLAKLIIEYYPEVSYKWLKDKEGDMVVNNSIPINESKDIKDLPHGEQMEILQKEIHDLKRELKDQKEENARNTEKIIEFIDEYLKPVFDFMQDSVGTKKKDNVK